MPTDLNSGCVANLPMPGIANEPPVAYSEATPDQRNGAWFFTEKLAAGAQKIARTNWAAATSLPGFLTGEGTTVKPFSFISVTEVAVTTDNIFDVNAEFCLPFPKVSKRPASPCPSHQRLPASNGFAGRLLPRPTDASIALDSTGKTGAASYLIARSDGDATPRPAVQPAAVKLLQNKDGAPQQITFEPIGNLKAGAAPVPLRASSDSGLPVEFSVISGPAVIRDGNLELTPIPPRAKLPVEIKVGAWQWGRASEPKVQTSAMVTQTLMVTP